MTNPINPEAIEALRAGAMQIFDGPECPQVARDVIEWFAASLAALSASHAPPAVSAEPVAWRWRWKTTNSPLERRFADPDLYSWAYTNEQPTGAAVAKMVIEPLYDHPAPQPQPSKAEAPVCISEIRAALNPPGRFKPTPGVWVADAHPGWVHQMTEVRTEASRDDGGHSIVRVHADFNCTVGKSEYEQANAAFVAACSPQNIGELLGYVDALAAQPKTSTETDSLGASPAGTACSVASLPETPGLGASVPLAGAWISVDEQTPPAQQMVLVWVSAVRYVEDEHGQQHEMDCSAVDFGHWQARVPEHGEPYMDNYAGRIGDSQSVTHWMQIPVSPTVCGTRPDPQPKAEPPAAQALGKCCYGGHKPKSACGSCAAWTPRGEALHKAAADAFEFLGERFGMSEDAHRPEAHRIWSALRAALAASPAAHEGWRWVPIEPTQEMLDAVAGEPGDDMYETMLEQFREDWAAMLSASPTVSGSGTAQSQEEQGKT